MQQMATTEAPFVFQRGSRPLLISMPHAGTYLPPSIAARMTQEARNVPDTDWHLPLLYDFAAALGASVLAATHSRYVIDLNRPPDNASLYPGQNTTGLCPVDTFDSGAVYLNGMEPGAAETADRLAAVWHPYHRQLEQELARLKAEHGCVVLWDAHSIRSVLPRFFEGKLADFNLGTNKGNSCDTAVADAVLAVARQEASYTSVLDGRFTGGYITRHYGNPAAGIHAIQLELAQCAYMEEQMPFRYRPELANRCKPVLRRMLETALDIADREA